MTSKRLRSTMNLFTSDKVMKEFIESTQDKLTVAKIHSIKDEIKYLEILHHGLKTLEDKLENIPL